MPPTWQPFVTTLIGASIAYVASVQGWNRALRNAQSVQDRDRAYKLRSIAGAMLAEVRRIRQELGIDDEWFEISFFGSRPVVPQLSPWIQPILVESVGANPNVIELFIELDRQLHNLGVLQRQLQSWRDEIDTRTKLRDELDKKEREADDAGNSETALKLMLEKMQVDAQIRQHEETAETLSRHRISNGKRIGTALNEIELLLLEVAKQPELLPKESWRSRSKRRLSSATNTFKAKAKRVLRIRA